MKTKENTVIKPMKGETNMGPQTITFNDIFGCNVTVTAQGNAAICNIERNGKCCYFGALPSSLNPFSENTQQVKQSVQRFVWKALVEENGKF